MAAAAAMAAKPADDKAKRPAAVPFQSRVVELTTGTADWQMPRSYGKHSAGKAPLCKENEELGWIKAAEGSWLGSNKSDWPPGSTDFTITFDVTSPDNAHFELQYAADNKVEGATLNGRALSVAATYGQDYKTLSKLSVETGKGLFKKGANTLSVQVANNGHADNPMGFYARGRQARSRTIRSAAASNPNPDPSPNPDPKPHPNPNPSPSPNPEPNQRQPG